MPVIPQYTLTYFDLMGKGEVIRMLFNYAGVKFTDKRISRAEWPAIKEKQPFGQLPVLEFDGKVLFQSRAIEKYLAKQFGLLGDDDFEAAQIDQYILSLDDVGNNLKPLWGVTDEAKKEELKKQISNDHVIPALKRFEGFLHKNGNKFFVGNKLSLADLAIFHLLFYITKLFGDSILDSFKDLKSFMGRISEEEKLKPYLQTRSQKIFL
uniref:glutathione transferase n=1 Tax=Parastrongyloides trichosuri TaxID=131310 RepID=A0A0N4ZE22_PARTI